jgi:hypothetical protein
MSVHPLNLALRFLLEIAARFSPGYWGWSQHQGILRIGLAVFLPLVAAAIWGTFSTSGDRSRSSKPVVAVPGLVRLILELALVSGAVWPFFAASRLIVAVIFAAVVVLHYGISYDRIVWLWKN